MTKYQEIRRIVEMLFIDSISSDYVNTIIDCIIDDVVQDVCECADEQNWNEDDVRLAIGRVLINKLNA